MGDKAAAAAAKSEIMKGKNLEDKAVEAAKSEIMKEYKLGRQGGVGAAKGEIMKENKLGRQDGSGSQKRNHEEKQTWETRRQRQPRAKSCREIS